METKTMNFKTNINCGGCVAKVTPFLNQNQAIFSWQVDTQNPDKILTIASNLTENQIVSLVNQAGFQVKGTLPQAQQAKQQGFWQDQTVWKKASLNTLNCLVGCSIGDFGMIISLQASHLHLPLWQLMGLAILAGLCTSILLETALLHYKEKMNWQQALQVALGMSLLSMVGMEIAMNLTDFMLTGGKADFHSHTYWLAFAVALVAGFVAPLPYNYYKLKKYNKACH
jgi:cation transport ATPase